MYRFFVRTEASVSLAVHMDIVFIHNFIVIYANELTKFLIYVELSAYFKANLTRISK